MKVFVLSLLLTLSPRLATAEIVSWVDDEGVYHYTNIPEGVPDFYRDTVRIVVKDLPHKPEADPPAPALSDERKRDHQRLAQVVYDRPVVSEEYMRGFIEGLSYSRGGERGDVDIDISGPLAVADARTAPYGPAYGYYEDPYPFVTTAFDRGRSRHLTLRMLLQEQFQLDRAAPYVYDARFVPPRLGVDLNPFHPRGLPRRFPRDVRVIRR